MKILFTSISLSREFVLEEKDQKLIIFSHLPKGVLRLEKVDDFFIKNNIYKNELTDNKIELQEINVEEYWLKYKNEKNYLKAIKKTFEEIKKEIKLSEKTIIIGPSLKPLVLLLEYYLYDKTNEL
ncbi:MAG TPA: hypothetical protein P5052_01615 [Candidatus Paceibacterota bacterium]|nr:hypothetical protein [Candidatus Paceibacterota bacterium]HRZ29460.1 hypothetical protein [Candidatus Paceibacterota bacterium]